jgi:PAS domain S-box-containing protein
MPMPAAQQTGSGLESLLNLVIIPTLLLDRQGRILAANPEFYQLISAEKGSLENKPVDEVIYAGDRKSFHEFIKRLPHQSSGAQHKEIRFRSLEERVVWSLASVSRVEYKSESFITVHAQEIEGLRNMQDRLKFTEEFLRSVGKLVKIGTWEVDLESSQVYWSPQTYEIHELDRSLQPKLEDAIQFYAPEARDTIRAAVEESVREGTGFDVTLPLITAKGRRIHVHAVGQVDKRDGKPVRLYGIFQDVTEEREIREQFLHMKEGLAKVQRMEALGVMTSGIAHDFNNINASIQGNAEILASRLDDDHSKELMADIIEGCRHARNLVHRILAFTRNEQKQVREKTAPHLIVSRAVSMTRPLATEDIDIVHDISEELPEISVDAYQVEEALVNLIYNAMQALEERKQKGKISITAQVKSVAARDGYKVPLPGHYVVFGVEDNGPGISPQVIKDIFKPFFTTKSEDNIGLGLPMVQEVMKSHGGAVIVEPNRKKGAYFQLYFPTDPETFSAEGAKVDEAARILLIDDEATFLRMMERALSSFGYRVNSFRSPLEGLQAYQSDPESYDLVITDLDLPWLDGHSVAKQVREKNPDIPIILVSGCNWKLEAPESDFRHFTGILTKPFSLDEMQSTISEALKKKSP